MVPSATHIHDGLTTIANVAMPLAIGWHVLFALVGLALLAGWKPSRRMAAALLTLPIFSVGVLAWAFDNPFNGSVFVALALALLAAGARLGEASIRRGPPWATGLGVLMALFGWVYPHFLEAGSPLRYLYAAPTGLAPCPTLAIVIGLTLIGDGIGTVRWSVLLGTAGIFYALFGTFGLGVGIDLLLLVGAAALIVRASWPVRVTP
jgi:hypothetical protein